MYYCVNVFQGSNATITWSWWQITNCSSDGPLLKCKGNNTRTICWASVAGKEWNMCTDSQYPRFGLRSFWCCYYKIELVYQVMDVRRDLSQGWDGSNASSGHNRWYFETYFDSVPVSGPNFKLIPSALLQKYSWTLTF